MKYLLVFVTLALGLTSCGPAAPSATGTIPTQLEVVAPSEEVAVTATDAAAVIFTATVPAAPTGTPTPVPPQMRASERDGMQQVFVPEGSVRMGGLDVHAENDEIPDHIVKMHAFWLDQLEVTNGMYGLCVQAGSCRPPQKVSSQKRDSYFGDPEFQDYPVIQITWSDAQTYCAWAERRLPTEAEWERAARGDDWRTYPWGDEPPTELYANFDNLIRDTSRVGSYAAGASPFGALDMAGNVWEWTADIYDPDYYLSSPAVDPFTADESTGQYQRVIRGGSYQDVWVDMRVSNRGFEAGPNPRAAFDSADLIGRSSAKIGFRCASDP
ncbi:MAG TPA: formylglycine-generating enzyme family protein [Anaerolineales bacterium]|jgi:serine/threonine-protein kinase